MNYRRLREFINPFKGLTVAKAITLLEEAQRGQYANVQWTYEVLERRYPELGALITRRISALKEMDWQIKTVTPETPDASHEALATKQAEWLRKTYEGISNLYEAVDTMGMAHFRGFGFAEKIRENGLLVELRKVNCWNLVKDGTIDAWKYNPNAWTYAQFQSVPGEPLPLERFVRRVVPRPIDVTGYDLRIDADFVRHARAYHPNLTDDDFRQIPQLISTADSLTPSTTNRGLRSVEFRKQVSERHWLLIGAQLTKQNQLQMVTLKKSSRGGKRP